MNAAEAAFLAMLLPSPIKYSRSYQKKDLTPFAKTRVLRILKDLQLQGRISDDEYFAGVTQADDFFGVRPPPPHEETASTNEIQAQDEDLDLRFDEQDQ